MATYEVPKSKASIKQNRFEFKMPDGKKYSVPKLEFLKPSLALELEESNVAIGPDGKLIGDVSEAIGLIKKIFDAYFPDTDLFALFEDAEQFGDWMEKWAESSGVTLGESEASPKS